MIPRPVVVRGVLTGRFPQGSFSEEDHPTEVLIDLTKRHTQGDRIRAHHAFQLFAGVATLALGLLITALDPDHAMISIHWIGRRFVWAQHLSFRRESTPLIVGQPKPFVSELFPQNSVFLSQVLDRYLLVLVDPTRENADEELPGLQDLGHPAILRPSGGRARLLLTSAQE